MFLDHSRVKPDSRIPPGKVRSRYASVKPSHGQIARNAGGCRAATAYWLIAKYDTPSMTTLPSHHGWSAIHCTRSWVSSASWRDSSFPVPSEWPQPRESAFTTVKPRAVHHAGSGASQPVSAENVTGFGWGTPRYCSENVHFFPRRFGRLSLP